MPGASCINSLGKNLDRFCRHQMFLILLKMQIRVFCRGITLSNNLNEPKFTRIGSGVKKYMGKNLDRFYCHQMFLILLKMQLGVFGGGVILPNNLNKHKLTMDQIIFGQNEKRS